jgi:hypothetical protein
MQFQGQSVQGRGLTITSLPQPLKVLKFIQIETMKKVQSNFDERDSLTRGKTGRISVHF